MPPRIRARNNRRPPARCCRGARILLQRKLRQLGRQWCTRRLPRPVRELLRVLQKAVLTSLRRGGKWQQRVAKLQKRGGEKVNWLVMLEVAEILRVLLWNFVPLEEREGEVVVHPYKFLMQNPRFKVQNKNLKRPKVVVEELKNPTLLKPRRGSRLEPLQRWRTRRWARHPRTRRRRTRRRQRRTRQRRTRQQRRTRRQGRSRRQRRSRRPTRRQRRRRRSWRRERQRARRRQGGRRRRNRRRQPRS